MSGCCHASSDQEKAKKYYRALLLQSLVAFVFGVFVLWNVFFPFLPSLKQADYSPVWIIIAIVATAVLYYSGRHFYQSAYHSFKNHTATMDTLVAIGTGVAWLYSMIVVFLPDLIPQVAKAEYFDTMALLYAFINFGAAMEIRVRGKTSSAIEALMGLQPKTTWVMRDGQPVEVLLKEVLVGDQCVLKPGEKVAVDGRVVSGESSVDESMVSGEPLAVAKKTGDLLTAGTLNQQGSLVYEALHVGKETLLAQIVERVKQAQNSRPKIAKIADKISAIFAPAVLIIAAITFIVWLNIDYGPGYILITSIAVLVIACPCALGLATPMSISVGIGSAASMGVLIRDGDALQAAKNLNAILLDKTGTITAGKPSVAALEVANGVDPESCLRLAASVEASSEHPLAQAIVAKATAEGLTLLPVEGFKAIAGFGVRATVQGKTVLLGSARFLERENINTVQLKNIGDTLAKKAHSVLYLSEDGVLQGLISVVDPIKPDSKAAIQHLQRLGLDVWMLTGDQKATANAVAAQVGIRHVLAETLPMQKEEKVLALQSQGYHVGMVGDGINDAPALARANVGFAIGSGTDVAMESSGITLMSGSLLGVVDAINISKATLRNIKQNLFGAFIYNSIGIPIAAGVFYPLFHLLLSPIFGGIAMALSSLTVIANANRLRLFKSKRHML